MATFLAQNAFISNSAQNDTCVDTAVAPNLQPLPPSATVVPNSANVRDCDRIELPEIRSSAGATVDLQALWDCITDDRFVLIGREGEDDPLPLFLRDRA